jgi:gliding motility-associated lipoprotein GldH
MKQENHLRAIPAWLSVVLLSIGLLAACKQDVAYAESRQLPREGWNATDTLVFSPVLESGEETVDLVLWIRHDKDYAYSNIWLKVITDLAIDDEDGMIEVRLADKTGKWLGTCSQSMCTAKTILLSNYSDAEEKAVKLAVLQYMRETDLRGIRNVGVEVRTATKVVEADNAGE